MNENLILAGGTLIDGTGGPPRRADIHLRGDVIAEVVDRDPHQPASPQTERADVLDCSGLVIAPGFIDIHTHSDLTVLANPSADSAVLQGVTTQVVGNCGFSPHPVHPDRATALADHVSGIGGETVPITWRDIDGYAEALAASPPTINIAPLIGHGALRIAAMVNPYAASTTADIHRMRALLRENLQAGAFGMSTGLTYPPSALAEPSEIESLASECAAADRIYATHSRALEDTPFGAIDEAIDVVRHSGVRLEYSHVAINNPLRWGRAKETLERFEAATAEGLPVGFDVYPYDASSSSAMQYLPYWVQDGGDAMLAVRGQDPTWRQAALADIRRGFFGSIEWQWDRIVLSAAPGLGASVGKSFAELADRWSVPPEQVLLDLCVNHGSAAQVVLHYRTEGDMQTFLASPLSVMGSDGLARPLSIPDHPHPRSFGAFPRVLGRYVRELAVLDLPSAIRKLSGEPARRLGLTRRGLVAAGMAADLVLFDPATVGDTATYLEPTNVPTGIVRTIVAGQTVQLNGVVTDVRPGGMIRCGETGI